MQNKTWEIRYLYFFIYNQSTLFEAKVLHETYCFKPLLVSESSLFPDIHNYSKYPHWLIIALFLTYYTVDSTVLTPWVQTYMCIYSRSSKSCFQHVAIGRSQALVLCSVPSLQWRSLGTCWVRAAGGCCRVLMTHCSIGASVKWSYCLTPQISTHYLRLVYMFQWNVIIK